MLTWLKKHYHWIIAAVLLLQLAIHGGAANNLSGIHLIPVTEALELTRTQYSLGASVKSVVAVFGTLLTGSFIMHYGYRKMAALGLALSAVSYLLFFSMDSYGVFLVGNALLGMTNGICTVAGVTRIVSAWFHRHRGMILGLVTAASGLGSSVLSILQTVAIEKFSWRASYLTVAALMFTVAALVYVFVRNFPEDLGLRPYGDVREHAAQKSKGHEALWNGRGMKELTQKPAFYLMLVGTFLSCLCVYLALSFVVPHLQDRGLTPGQATALHSVMMLLLSGTKFIAGTLSDSIGAKKVTMICLVSCVAGLALLASVNGFVWAAVAVVIYSLALPIVTVTIPLLAVTLFGYQAQPQYTGIFMSMVSAASILAGPVSNAVYDRVGSYSPVFYCAAGLTVINILVYAVLYRCADRDRKAFEKEKEPV